MKQASNTDAYEITADIRARHPEVAGPAYSARGQRCGQCGELAWHVQAMPFCLDHDQDTLAKSEGRTLGKVAS